MQTAPYARHPRGPAATHQRVLQPDWPGRTAALIAAKHVNDQHAGVTLLRLLNSWQRWHRFGEVPPAGPLRNTAFARFVENLRVRLVAGAKTYSDSSFTRRAAELSTRSCRELDDVCDSALLLRIRLDRVSRCDRRMVEKGGNDG